MVYFLKKNSVYVDSKNAWKQAKLRAHLLHIKTENLNLSCL